MSYQDDQALREILEALTRLRLSHDRLQQRRREEGAPRVPSPRRSLSVDGSGGDPVPLGGGSAPLPLGRGSAAPAFAAVPWLDETPWEPTLESLVGAEVIHRPESAGPGAGTFLRRDVAVETRMLHLRGLGAALRETLPETGALAGLTQDADLLAEARADELVFLDLETTGLHRGNIVLLGYMALGPGERPLTVTQMFPRDHGEEAPMLAEFLELLRRNPILVTFNGRSFDAPYLESRLRWHGFLEPLRYAHVDLLHLSRRIWEGLLPDFKLQTLERRLFGRRRIADLPGSEIPRVWEDYVRSGELRHLPEIWEHNLRDLTTLAELLIRAVQDVGR